LWTVLSEENQCSSDVTRFDYIIGSALYNHYDETLTICRYYDTICTNGYSFFTFLPLLIDDGNGSDPLHRSLLMECVSYLNIVLLRICFWIYISLIKVIFSEVRGQSAYTRLFIQNKSSYELSLSAEHVLPLFYSWWLYHYTVNSIFYKYFIIQQEG